MEQTQWEADQIDRKNLVQDFVNNCESPAVVPEFDTAIKEFLFRLDDETFELITSDIHPVVFNSFGASTAGRLFVPCIEGLLNLPVENKGHYLPFVLIGGGFMKRSEKGRVGEIAHEFAHVVLNHNRGGRKLEAEADQLARAWGFEAEIDELNSDGNGPHG